MDASRHGKERVLIIKPSSLGDIVQALWALAVIRSRMPGAAIAWLARDCYVPFLARHPHIDLVIGFVRHAKGHRLLTEQFRLARCLHAFSPHIAVDLQGLARSAFFTLLSGAPRRIGMSDAREGARVAYTEVVHIPRSTSHAIERYLTVAHRLCNSRDVVLPALPTCPDASQRIGDLLARLGTAPIAVAPGARWVTKRMPPDWYAVVAEEIARKSGLPVVVLGTTEEAPLCNRVYDRLRNKITVTNLCGQTSLLELTELFRRCRLFLGNDSGTAHLAAAAGCPVLVVFTCTSPRRAAPRGAPTRILQTNVPCRGSYRKQCSSLACLQTIPPTAAVEAGLELLHRVPLDRAA